MCVCGRAPFAWRCVKSVASLNHGGPKIKLEQIKLKTVEFVRDDYLSSALHTNLQNDDTSKSKLNNCTRRCLENILIDHLLF